MKFRDMVVNRAERFSMGVEEESGRYFLSFPVSNEFAEYEEYFELTPSQFALFRQDGTAARAFVSACRRREKDGLSMVEPGRLRGAAI